MKKGMMVALCLAFALSGHGQMDKGRLTIEPHVGMTIANVIGSGSMGSTAQVGFMGGAELQYGISDMYKIPCKKPGQRSKIWLIHFDRVRQLNCVSCFVAE